MTQPRSPSWQEKDPILRFEALPGGTGVTRTDEIKEKVAAAAKTEIEAAIQFAEESPFPPAEELSERGLCSRRPGVGRWEANMREMMYRDAIREALAEEMRRDPRCFFDGRGCGRTRRQLSGHHWPLRRVWGRACLRHPVKRIRPRRGGCWSSHDGNATDCGDDVRGFCHHCHGCHRQPCCQGKLYVRGSRSQLPWLYAWLLTAQAVARALITVRASSRSLPMCPG